MPHVELTRKTQRKITVTLQNNALRCLHLKIQPIRNVEVKIYDAYEQLGIYRNDGALG
jgi:preprotein translocase subunit Sec63